MLERSTQRGCCRFKVNRSEGAHDYFLPLSLSRRRDIAVLIHLFRDEANDNVALTIDVTGQNIPPISPSTDWLFVEAIDTVGRMLPWDMADLQCVLHLLSAEGFYLLEPGVKDPKKTTRWMGAAAASMKKRWVARVAGSATSGGNPEFSPRLSRHRSTHPEWLHSVVLKRLFRDGLARNCLVRTGVRRLRSPGLGAGHIAS